MDSVEVRRLAPNALIPQKMSSGAAGFDLSALDDEDIPPFEAVHIRTGVNIYVPEGYYGAIKGRSGNAFKRNMFIYNDVINSGYREEIVVFVMNFNKTDTLHIKAGDRIAQIILTKLHPSHHITEIATGNDNSTITSIEDTQEIQDEEEIENRLE